MAQIFEHRPLALDIQIGWIDTQTGNVYQTRLGPDRLMGRVDYEKGRIFRRRFGPDEYIGCVKSDGRVYLARPGMDRYVGVVNQKGEIYRHKPVASDTYLGVMKDMQALVEGGAALLLFFMEDNTI